MADKKVTELTAIDVVSAGDLLLVIDDPAGTPLSKKAAVSQLLASPALTGTPTAPTPAAADSSTLIATTAFVQGELDVIPGVFTPVFTGDSTTGGATYASRSGTYLKFKKLVFVQFEVNLSAKGGAAGLARISGLPYANGGAGQIGLNASFAYGVTFPAGITQITGVVVVAQTDMYLVGIGSGTVSAALNCSAVGDNAELRFNGFYPTLV